MDNYMFGEEIAKEMTKAFEVDDTVNIPRDEYEELLGDSMFLEALTRAGVDNWDGYDYAQEIFDEMNESVRPTLRLVSDGGTEV